MSISQLVLGNLGALFFVIMFRIQRSLFPGTYLYAIPLVYGVSARIKYSIFLIRMLVVALFAALLFVVAESTIVTVYAVGFGSFLVIWPGILYPEYLEWYARQRIWAAYVLFLSFIVLCMGISLMAVAAVIWARPESVSYYSALRQPGGAFGLLVDLVLGLAIAKGWTRLAQWLSEERDV